MMTRLDKLIADTGKCSRREAKELIRSGRVFVSGTPATRPDAKADLDTEPVAIDGNVLRFRPFRYFMMDKPPGVLTATRDGRKETVLDLLPPELRRIGLFPVGRLDRDTTGLLILTDDGGFAHKVISPKAGVQKVYLAQTEGTPGEADIRAFAEGVTLRDGMKCLPAKLEPLEDGRCLVTVCEGKYHQVKRMLASVGKPVTVLRRLSVGSLQIDETLGAGGYKELTEKEKNAVFMHDLCK